MRNLPRRYPTRALHKPTTHGEETLPRIPCLTRLNGGPWGLRRRVPDDLRPILGKREIWKSYGTDNHDKARQIHNREMAILDAMFAEARRKLAEANGASVQPGGTPVLVVATEEDIRAAALAWFHTQERKSAAEDRAGLHRLPGATPPDPDEMLTILGTDEATLEGERGRQWAEKAARGALARHGFTLPEGELRALAADLLQRAALETVRRSVRRWSGVVGETSLDADFAGITAASKGPPPPQSPRLTFKELADAYLAAPERADISPKTKLKYGGMFRVLSDLLGAGTIAASITREDCRKAQAVLMKLPANAMQRYPGMDSKQVVEAAQRDGTAPMHPKSAGNHLDLLAALYRWSIRERLVRMPEGNPAEGLNAATAKNVTATNGTDRRRPFTTQELRLIFAQPLFTGCKDDEKGYDKPGSNRPRRGRFWVPLLSLFAGLRLNEACQLAVADVIEDDGVPMIYVRASADGQRLKTSAAERRIPVHPELVRLGFLDVVTAQRREGHERLFPELLVGPLGNYSDSYSKWFARLLSKAGVTSKGAVFHSFRHGWRDRLREAGVPRDVSDALGGWASQGEGMHYGAGFSARVLAEHIGRVAYPSLDLRALMLAGHDAEHST